MSCCSSATCGITGVFDAAKAVEDLRRYRRKGPDPTTKLLIEALKSAMKRVNLRDLTLLDIGGGIGVLHHELVNGRVRDAVHVDAAPALVQVAREETERRGHGGRVRFVVGDFVDLADQIEPADLVTLDRVICCYPDMDHLVSESAVKARRFYGAAYPRMRWAVRVGVAIENLFRRIRGSAFRSYLHSPAAIAERLEAAGLELAERRRTFIWEVIVFERRA